ncbi:MAG: ECF transporter S component, partial [Clostridia bacterium]|nr:ECF transporter S component [Clostridia bacterium]
MEKTSKNNKVKRICITGLMAALICVATAFIKMPTGINSGYLHFGDSMIYLAGCLLGPWASLAAAIGGALADVISGAPQWAPATAIIKAINA